MQLRVFDICREGTYVLGPGRRYVVWVQGCLRRCKGCITPESRPMSEGIGINVSDLAADIILTQGISGITISGGEPFLQAEALGEMLTAIKTSRPELTVIIYTGFTIEELGKVEKSSNLIALCDVLIDGEYIDSMNDNQGIRGSANQRIIMLTDRLKPFENQMNSGVRHVEHIAIDKNHFNKIGLPRK